jgi:hypothetical protein
MWTCSVETKARKIYYLSASSPHALDGHTSERETRDIGEVILVEGDQGRPVHQSLGCDHPVEQLPPRVASAGDNGPIGLRRKIGSWRKRLFAGRGSTPCVALEGGVVQHPGWPQPLA